jgi:hypothetical protein
MLSKSKSDWLDGKLTYGDVVANSMKKLLDDFKSVIKNWLSIECLKS